LATLVSITEYYMENKLSALGGVTHEFFFVDSI